MSPITRKVISGFITLGTVVAMGALSFVGATHFTSLLPICALAFLLTGTVDAQMFWQNFSEALKSLFDPTDLERTLIRQRLKKLLEDKVNQENEQQISIENNLFLQDYIKAGQELAKLKHEQQHQHDNKDITDQAKAELKSKIEKFIARQRWMEEFILKRSRANKPAAKTIMEQAADAVLNIKVPKSTTTYFGDFDKETSRKQWLIRIGFGACLIIGAFNFFAMIGTWELGVASFATFAVIPGGVVIPLMLLGAMGFALLMYQGILDVVKNGLLHKWKQQIQSAAELSKENKWKMGAIYFAAIVTVGLGIFAMVCTAGTWFNVMGSDAQMLTSLTMGIANIIGWVGAVVLAVPLMLFNTVNNLEAFTRFLKQASRGIKGIFSKLWSDIKAAWSAENFIQFINPFRLIAKIITSTLFVLHMAADGMQADAFPERYAAAIDTGISNGLVEFASVYEEQLGDDAEKDPSKKEHKHGAGCSHGHHHDDHHAHETTALLSSPLQPAAVSIAAAATAKKAKSYEFLDADNKHDHHSHVFFDVAIFLGPFLPGLIWDLVLGSIWYYTLGALGRIFCPPEKPVPPPSFAAVKERFFSKHEHRHHHDAEEDKTTYKCSDAWLVQEVIERVEEDQNSYLYISKEIGAKNRVKQELVEQLRDAKLMMPASANLSAESADVKAVSASNADFVSPTSRQLTAVIGMFKDTNNEVLAKHRNSSSKGETHSVEFLNELTSDNEYKGVQLAAAAAA